MPTPSARPAAILFDRDGTLVVDVPYNGDPEAVRPTPTARAALDLVRAAGLPVGVVSNQSGIGRGLLLAREVARVNQRVEQLLGPFAVWEICPHAPEQGCSCRKPAPGMLRSAARRLGLRTEQLALIGDIGADVEAAGAAGSHSVLVPTPVTRPAEVAAAPLVAADLVAAVRLLLGSPAVAVGATPR